MANTGDQSSSSSWSLSSDFNGTDYGEPGLETVVVPAVWSLLIAVGVSANALVVYVVVGQARTGRLVTDCYIANLALTDITFLLVCVPFSAAVYSLHGELSEGLCRVVSYVQQASVHATCMTLTTMSADRYFAIVYPIKSLKYRTRRLSVLLNLGVWILSFIMAIPAAIFVEEEAMWYYVGEKSFCFEDFSSPAHQSAYYTYVLLCTYVVPLAVITGCYTLLLRAMWARGSGQGALNGHRRAGAHPQRLQQRRRTTRMLVVVVFLFFLAWLPVHVLNCWQRYSPATFPHGGAAYDAVIFANSLAYSNSCVNPFVYAFMGRNFRDGLRRACPLCARGRVAGEAVWGAGGGGSTRRGTLLVPRLGRRGTVDAGTRVSSVAGREVAAAVADVDHMGAPFQEATL